MSERLAHDCERIDLRRGRTRLASSADDDFDAYLLRGLEQAGNEGSRSVEVRSGGRRILLCGDAEGEGLLRQLKAGHLEGPYDLVLFPHHGSETPWLGPFLDATRPAPERSGSAPPSVPR